MIKNIYLAVFSGAVFGTLAMSSCTGNLSEDEMVRETDDRVEWEMRRASADSRAVIDDLGSGRFESGDTVVLYARNLADGELRHYTLCLSDGRWEPEIRWAEIGQEVQFTAWYLSPADRLHQAAQVADDYLHPLAGDQSADGYNQSDLLCATARVRAGETVPLTFGHVLSRLKVVLESGDASWSDEELQQAQVQIRTPARLSFRLTDGSLEAASGEQWITPARQADNSRVALLCPQAAEAMPADGWIRVRIGDRETTVKIPESVDGKPFEGLAAGKEMTYRLQVRKADTPDAFAGATRWVYGVKEPADDAWNYDHTQLAWTEGCGWFDCNKVNPSDVTSGGDGLMCWAAATSNLIHWWLEQNRQTEAVQAYDGPKAQPSDMLHSEIFGLYKAHFSNRGDYPLKGINWFFNGVFHKNLYETDQVDPAAGFFREQLGIRTLGAEYVGTDLMRDRFNALVKQALDARMGILFVVNMGKAWTTHAVTLWGAKFDEQGLIETLYMVDNNDGRSDPRGTIRTMEVRYLPYSATNPDLYPYVPNSVGEFAVRIESLCTLSLGREWIQ